jgi:hypothetical protein
VEDERQLDMVVASLISGLVGLLTWWLGTEGRFSAEATYAWSSAWCAFRRK